MKKYLLIIFAALVLMLTACARASEEADGGTGTPEITTAPTQTTASLPTTQPTTEPTPPPSTDPILSGGSYDIPVKYYYVAVYDNYFNDLYGSLVENLDTTDCIEEALYSINVETGKTSLICNSIYTITYEGSNRQYKIFAYNYDYVYYVSASEPNKIIRATHDGCNKTVIYTGNTITDLDYYGGPDGMIGFVENSRNVYRLDTKTNECRLVLSIQDCQIKDTWFGSQKTSDYVELDCTLGKRFAYYETTKELLDISKYH